MIENHRACKGGIERKKTSPNEKRHRKSLFHKHGQKVQSYMNITVLGLSVVFSCERSPLFSSVSYSVLSKSRFSRFAGACSLNSFRVFEFSTFSKFLSRPVTVASASLSGRKDTRQAFENKGDTVSVNGCLFVDITSGDLGCALYCKEVDSLSISSTQFSEIAYEASDDTDVDAPDTTACVVFDDGRELTMNSCCSDNINNVEVIVGAVSTETISVDRLGFLDSGDITGLASCLYLEGPEVTVTRVNLTNCICQTSDSSLVSLAPTELVILRELVADVKCGGSFVNRIVSSVEDVAVPHSLDGFIIRCGVSAFYIEAKGYWLVTRVSCTNSYADKSQANGCSMTFGESYFNRVSFMGTVQTYEPVQVVLMPTVGQVELGSCVAAVYEEVPEVWERSKETKTKMTWYIVGGVAGGIAIAVVCYIILLISFNVWRRVQYNGRPAFEDSD